LTTRKKRARKKLPKQTESTNAPRSYLQQKLPGVAAVDRALSVLNAFQRGNHCLTLTELMEETGLHGSTILRLLATLERNKFVVRLDHGRYRLGSQLLTLGMIYQKSFRLEEYILPVLHRLSQHTGESAGFSVPDGDTLLVLLRVNSPQPVREDFSAGHRTLIRAGAAGKVTELFSAGIDAVEPSVFAQIPMLVVGGIYKHVAAISAPVFDSAGKYIGAISISGPKERFNDADVNRFKSLLLSELRQLAKVLGAPEVVFGAPVRQSSRTASSKLHALATT
jgi:DNA-binding IclR family transcriptional regulator